MTHEAKRWDDSGQYKALKFWPMIVGFTTFTFALGISSKAISNVERLAAKNEIVNERQEARLAAQEQNIVEINKRLDRIENKLDAILRAVK